MAKTTEQKFVFSNSNGGKITRVITKIAEDSKSVEIIIISENPNEQQSVFSEYENFDEVFPIVDPSELIGHRLLKHSPKMGMQKELKDLICEGIKQKLPAFRVACMDPSEENGKIIFKPGKPPAVGHSAIWWDETWKEFMPNKNSRSGTELHYAAFLGNIMRHLIDVQNYSVAKAWKSICGNDSRDLGHYLNSKTAKGYLEFTGNRKVGSFFDLANTKKILVKSDFSGFFKASGSCNENGFENPLSSLETINYNCYYGDCVGWPIFDV